MRVILLFLIFLSSFPLFSQTVVKEDARTDTLFRKQTFATVPASRGISLRKIRPQNGKWSFGGSYGMAFGDQTTIEISPQISYSRNAYFALGGGLSYSHYYYSRKGIKEKWNYLGLDLFARITPFPYLAFQIQPEVLERWGKSNGKRVSSRFVPTLLAGGGFQIPAGPGSINLMFFYDIIQHKYTPYGDGLYYSVGYSFFFK